MCPPTAQEIKKMKKKRKKEATCPAQNKKIKKELDMGMGIFVY